MSRNISHKDFLNLLYSKNKHYRMGEFEVLGIYSKMKSKILIKDKYSEHLKICERLINGEGVSSKTSLNITEYYKNYIKHNCSHFCTDKYKIESVFKMGSQYRINIDTPYGKCVMIPSNIFKGSLPSIDSAIDKTEYLINQLKSRDIGITDYSKIKYKSALSKVTYLTEFGYCEMTPNSLLSCKTACSINSAKNKTEYIKNVIIKERGNKFDLSKLVYKDNRTPIKIGCKEHGIFEVMPNNFIGSKSHRGCPRCGREESTKSAIENPVGWSHKNWENAGNSSKNFDSFKVYIIKCYNENEIFYKIGRTFLKTSIRFRGSRLPYNYEILHELVSSNAKHICNIERKLKNINKSKKYIPTNKFEGMYECFTDLEDCNSYINLIKDLIK